MPFQNSHKKFHKFWPEHLKVSKILNIIFSFWAKNLFFELKKCRWIIFHEAEEGYKSSRGMNLSFQNWHNEIDKFWPEHSKDAKIFTLIGSFWAKYLLLELKKYRGIIFHDTEEDTKVGEESACFFKIDVRNLVNFYLTTLKSSTFLL